MSIHPSLSSSDKDKKARSVLKRSERLRIMLDKGQWKEGDDVFGLPKIKTIKLKFKKEKAEKVEATAAEGAAPAASESAQPAAKTTASKGQDKK